MCRRSARIQKNAKNLPTSYIKHAQRVLMSKMGICELQDEPTVDYQENMPSFSVAGSPLIA